jgi:hypothetical protein
MFFRHFLLVKVPLFKLMELLHKIFVLSIVFVSTNTI